MAIEVTHLDQIEVWLEASGVGSENHSFTIGSITQQGVPATSIHIIGEDAAPATRPPAFRSELVVYVRAGRVAPGAVQALIQTMNRFPQAGVAYGNSSFFDGTGIQPPATSLLWLRGVDFLGPIIAFRSNIVQQDHTTHAGGRALDWALRAVEDDQLLVAIPMVLGITNSATQPKPDAITAQTKAVEQHLLRQKIQASVEIIEPSIRRVRYAVAGSPLVSIILTISGARATVAGRERWLAVDSLRSVIDGTTYPRVEFIVLVAASTPREVLAEIRSLLAGAVSHLLFETDEIVESGRINSAIERSSGEFVAVLSGQMELISQDWIENMIGLAAQPDVGVVGGMLFAEHGPVDHAGYTHADGVISSAGRGLSLGMPDLLGTLRVDHEVSAVSGECLFASRSVLLQLGGFSPALTLAMAGLDLSLKARAEGLTAICSPHSRWYIFRTQEDHSADLPLITERWSSRLQVEIHSRALL